MSCGIITLGKLAILQRDFGPAMERFDTGNLDHIIRVLAVYLDTTVEIVSEMPMAHLEIAAGDFVADFQELFPPNR